jgi:hypothetical protein
MPSSLTPLETVVVDLLRRRRVATLAQLQAAADCSHMTVFRGLDKTGYYTSLNENSRWYILAQTPRFDAQGLWGYRQLVFSRHGTLTQTLRVLVDTSPAGYTVSELETKVHTPVANLLCRLGQAGQIAARRLERHAVYLAVEATQQARQWTQRLAVAAPPSPPSALSVPPDWETLPLLRLLVQMIHTPKASAAQLAHTLQKQGWACRPEQVHQVIAFYELKKKRHASHG